MSFRMSIAYFLAATLLMAGCSGSKSFSKKGEKLDEAGLYAEAAEMYLQAARRSAKNVDAKIGLKKTGQMVLNDGLSTFFKQVATGSSKGDAVATYLKAEDYVAQVKAAGVNLEIPDHYRTDFEKVKGEHLVELYTEGQVLFAKEEFPAAERVFARIAKLEPNYKDANSLQDVAYLEPLYRQASTDLAAGQYRKAHAQFSKVCDKNSAYKDAAVLREECVSRGQFVVAVLPFTSSVKGTIASKVQAHAMTALTETKDPFLKVVDRENMERILEEQRLSLSGVVDEKTAVRVGNLIGAHAVLMGTVVDYRETPGSIRRSTKEAFESYKVAEVNKETNEKYFVTRYRPVNYTEYLLENKVSLSFNYRLVSLETGEVLVSKVAENEASDRANYATYEGNKDALVPKASNGATDLSDRGRNQLRSLLSASREVQPVPTLMNEVLRRTSSNMASTIQQDLSSKLP